MESKKSKPSSPVIYASQLETELAEARAEPEKFNLLFTNGIECFMTPCEKHSGENTPPFDEFMAKYGRKCTPCLVDEIGCLKQELRDNSTMAARQIIPAEMAAEDGQLEVQRLNAECNKLDTECNKWVKRLREKEEGFAITLRHMSIQIEQKDKLIEQMREALSVLVANATNSGPLWHGSAEMQIAIAALSTAERGE